MSKLFAKSVFWRHSDLEAGEAVTHVPGSHYRKFRRKSPTAEWDGLDKVEAPDARTARNWARFGVPKGELESALNLPRTCPTYLPRTCPTSYPEHVLPVSSIYYSSYVLKEEEVGKAHNERLPKVSFFTLPANDLAFLPAGPRLLLTVRTLARMRRIGRMKLTKFVFDTASIRDTKTVQRAVDWLDAETDIHVDRKSGRRPIVTLFSPKKSPSPKRKGSEGPPADAGGIIWWNVIPGTA